MSNGDAPWNRPGYKYRTSGVSGKGHSPSHLATEDLTAPFKEVTALEKHRVEEENKKIQLEQALTLKALGIGQKVLDTRYEKNKQWKLSDEAIGYKDTKYKVGDDELDVFRFSDDYMTGAGYAKQTMEFTPEMIEYLSDTGNLQTFFASDEGQGIMHTMQSDSKRFSRMPGFQKNQWKDIMGMDPGEIDTVLSGWAADPKTAPKKWLDWGTTPNINEAQWATGMGVEDPDTLQELTKGCFGKRGGAGCFGGTK